MSTDAPKKPDWERIEADYRAGLLSLRAMAATQGISHTAIQQRAKKAGWERNTRSKIEFQAMQVKPVRQRMAESARPTIDANVPAIVDVRLAHRADIARSRKLVRTLMQELEAQTECIDAMQDLGAHLRAPNEKDIDKLNDAYHKAISLGSRTATMKTLSETLKILIVLEREAYGIVAGETGAKAEVPSGLGHFYGEPE